MKSESRNDAQLESPAWHEDVLRDREAKIRSGTETFMDWETVKKQLVNWSAQRMTCKHKPNDSIESSAI